MILPAINQKWHCILSQCFFRLSQIPKSELRDFFEFFQRNLHRTWQTILQNPYLICESQLEIISPKIQGLCFAFQATLCCFFPKFLKFVQFHNESNIFIWVKKHFWSTLERKTSISNRAYKGHGKKVSNVLFALFSWFFKIWTRNPHRMWKPSCKPFV